MYSEVHYLNQFTIVIIILLFFYSISSSYYYWVAWVLQICGAARVERSSGNAITVSNG